MTLAFLYRVSQLIENYFNIYQLICQSALIMLQSLWQRIIKIFCHDFIREAARYIRFICYNVPFGNIQSLIGLIKRVSRKRFLKLQLQL